MRVALIPARGGSRRIPGKNIKDFHGKPIIQYSIELARDSGLFDSVVVSTDDAAIANIARVCRANAVQRSDAMSRDEVGTQHVAWGFLTENPQLHVTKLCVIYATSPMLTFESLAEGLARLGTNDYAMSVGTEPLRDAAQFYWGHASSFLNEVPLIGPRTVMIPIPEDRVCDINTMVDWVRAGLMYERLK